MKGKYFILIIFFTTLFGLTNILNSQLTQKEIEERLKRQKPPFKLYENAKLIKDIVFWKKEERELKLDLYVPKKGTPSYPGIVFIHGGGWSRGFKEKYRRQASYFADKGFVCACITYRLAGETKFPGAIEDCKCGVRWMRANAEKYGIDSNRIAVIGGSAGGHLAGLVGTSGGVKELEGDGRYNNYSSKVNLVVAFFGVFDMADMVRKGTSTERGSTAVQNFIGGSLEEFPEKYKMASPVTFIDKSDPPVLLFHGTEDKTVPYIQSVKFKKLLEEAGVPVKLITAEGAGHGHINVPPYYEPTIKQMEEFINKYFR